MRVAVVALLLASTVAVAKPWNEIAPGSSTRAQVVEKFGEPSKVVKVDGKEILAYMGQKAIKGTRQAQFRMDRGGVVERIDVFPGPVIDLDTIVNSYGSACPADGTIPAKPCYLKKVTEGSRMYFDYARLGLAVFFNPDGKTVNSFVFRPDARAAQEAQR